MLCDLSLPSFDTVIRNSKYCFKMQCRTELSVGWVDPRVGLGWVGWVGNGSKFCIFSGLGWVMGLK